MFGTLDLLGKPTREERKATKYMMRTWVAFTKDPEHGLQKLGWKMYNPGGMFNASKVEVGAQLMYGV